MCLVVSKRDKGGGYSRKGGLFLGGINDSNYLSERTDYVQYLGHEIAHFWWQGATGNWEDWLNESFAEYSALNLIKELSSKEEFNTKLNIKRSESSNTPPIWGISRSDPSAEQVLYSKGVVLLNELEEKIGKNKFLELYRARIDKKINNTLDFLNLIKDTGGKETADWFVQSLKNR
jgi:aminopeptidase N